METSERRSESVHGIVLTAVAALLYSTPAAAAELNLFPSLPVLAGNLIVFLLLIYPVTKLILRPIVGILEERERRTGGAIEEAEAVTRESTGLRGEIDERLRAAAAGAQSIRAEIAAEADAQQRELLAEARAEAGRIVESVRVSVAEDLEQAREALRSDAQDLAAQAAERILGRRV